MKTIDPTISTLRMLASLRSHQWMIRPDMVSEFALEALAVPDAREDSYYEDRYPMRAAAVMDGDRVGHLEVKGALMNNCPRIYERLGIATRYATISAESDALKAMGAVAILFHVDSPGGTVAGNIEACDSIKALGIPTASYCSGLACSAAYKISASTDQIFASQSAQVGNIGTILSWADCTEFWKKQGVEFKAITNDGADLKSTFHLEPNEAQLEFLQESINEAGQEFRMHVERGRPGIDLEVFRAGWYSGARAGELGLVDGIGPMEMARQWLIRATGRALAKQ